MNNKASAPMFVHFAGTYISSRAARGYPKCHILDSRIVMMTYSNISISLERIRGISAGSATLRRHQAEVCQQ